MRVYLAGSVPKGDREARDYTDWREEYSTILSTVTDIELSDPNVFYRLEGDSQAVVGADCMYIRDADIVVVNAEERLGAGTSMELVVAKYFSIPVITVLPRGSQHRRTDLEFHGRVVADWIHPFIDTFSDRIIESASELPDAVRRLEDMRIKGISVIDEAIDYARTKI